MADRYWVGGSGTWNATSTTNWATSSGGAGGASAPTFEDNVIFDSLSNATAYTVTVGTNAVCADLTADGPLVGNVTFSLGATAVINCHSSMTLAATGITWTGTAGANLVFRATVTGKTVTTNGVSLTNTAITFDGVGGGWTLGSAFTHTGNIFFVTNGSFDTGNFNLTTPNFFSTNSNIRSIALGSSAVNISGTTAVNFSITTNLTFNAGTSTITCSAASPTFNGGGQTFYNVSFTSTAIVTVTITGANTFNDLTFAARAAAGTGFVSIGADQTINGTLTLGSGTTGVARLSVQSSVIGTPRTLTVATLAAPTDIDFRDIVAAGASSPWSGTRLGNCLGNNNITFDAGKTVYWNLAAGGSYVGAAWATTSGGTAATTNYPLAQDTAIVENTGLNTSATINLVSYNTGTIDMSTRSNAMTLNYGSNNTRIYGNVIFSSAVTSTATTGTLNFNGQGTTQTITSAGVTFTQAITIQSPSGTVQLLDNLTSSNTGTGAFTLTAGTLDLNEFNLSIAGRFTSTNTNTRSIDFGTAGKLLLTFAGGGAGLTILSTGDLTNFSYSGNSHIELSGNNTAGTRSISIGTTAATEAQVMNVFVSAGSDTVSISSQGKYKNLNFTGFSGTLGASSNTIYGNVILSSTMNTDFFAGTWTFAATSGTQEFTSNGVVLQRGVTVNSPSATFQLQDNLTIPSTTFLFTTGTLDLNDKVLTIGAMGTNVTQTRLIDFGRNGVINCEGGWIANATGLTTAGRGRIKMSSASAKAFAGGGATYAGVALEQAGAGTLTITGANTFDDITNSNATASQITFPANTTTSVRKLSVSGSSGNLVSLRSSTEGTAFTIQTV